MNVREVGVAISDMVVKIQLFVFDPQYFLLVSSQQAHK